MSERDAAKAKAKAKATVLAYEQGRKDGAETERERIARVVEAERFASVDSGFPAAWFSAMDRAAHIARSGDA